MSVISARSMTRRYRDVAALDGFDLEIAPGRIVGLIGPNGSGKTTALNALLGLNRLDDGQVQVLGHDPQRDRAALMGDVAYIADTGILPRWMRIRDLVDYVAGVHPRFDREAALARIGRTEIRLAGRVRDLSKGMHVQLHLALILAIDARLLVLDEPTLGLDILYRQQFYDAILGDYFNAERSILITTHEVREVEHMLTDVVLIHRGRAHLSASMDELAERFAKLTVASADGAPSGAISQRNTLAGVELIYDGVPRAMLEDHGEVSTPNLAELFVAMLEAS